jgi:hypothetical protein
MPPRRVQFNAARIPLPLLLNTWEFSAAWADWCFDKEDRGHPLTQRAATIALNKCAELGPEAAIAAIRHSIECGYQGIYPAPQSRQQPAKQSVPAPEPQWVAERRQRETEAKIKTIKEEMYNITHPGGLEVCSMDDIPTYKRDRWYALREQLNALQENTAC